MHQRHRLQQQPWLASSTQLPYDDLLLVRVLEVMQVFLLLSQNRSTCC